MSRGQCTSASNYSCLQGGPWEPAQHADVTSRNLAPFLHLSRSQWIFSSTWSQEHKWNSKIISIHTAAPSRHFPCKICCICGDKIPLNKIFVTAVSGLAANTQSQSSTCKWSLIENHAAHLWIAPVCSPRHLFSRALSLAAWLMSTHSSSSSPSSLSLRWLSLRNVSKCLNYSESRWNLEFSQHNNSLLYILHFPLPFTSSWLPVKCLVTLSIIKLTSRKEIPFISLFQFGSKSTFCSSTLVMNKIFGFQRILWLCPIAEVIILYLPQPLRLACN